MTAAVRESPVIADLRFLVPGIVLILGGLALPPWAALLLLVLAQPLLAAGAARVLGYELDDDFAGLVLRRGPVQLGWLLLYALLVLGLIGWPLQQLLHAHTPLLALALSAGFLISIGAALRLWPAPGLALVWDDAHVSGRAPQAFDRCAAFALHLTGRQGDRHFGVGVLVALLLVLLVLGAALASGFVPEWPPRWQQPARVGYAFVLAPAVHLLLLWRTAALLLGPDDEAPASEAPVVADGGVPEGTRDLWDEPAGAATPAAVDPADRGLALLNAAAAGQTAQALALLEAGADANVAPGPNDRDQRSPLCIAATLSDLSLLRALIAHGADPNLAVGGISALHAATRDSLHGRPDAVMTLIANGARPDRCDPDGNTPLHHAALSEDPTISAMLLDAGAPPDQVNREGLSALAISARAGNEAVLRLLLERGARPEPARGLSALIAAASGHEDRAAILKRLLKAKADPAATDKLGRSALHAAALHGHGDCVDTLVAAGADVNARDAHGVTPLMEAARAGANRVLARLLFRKPDPCATDAHGRTALHLACASKQANLDTVKALLATGIDRDAAARDGRRAIDIAAAAGRWDLVAAIDPAAERPASIDATEPDPVPAHASREPLLLDALRAGHVHVADELLALEPPLATETLLRALRIVLERDHLDAFDALLRHGFDPLAAPLDDNEALQLAARMQPPPLRCLQRLLDGGASASGAGVLLPLLANAVEAEPAARPAVDRFAQALVERGADCFARISSGESALHLALRAGLDGCARLLLARGFDPNARDRAGLMPLHLALRLEPQARATLLPPLLRAGADPERAAADGETPLGRATLLRQADSLRLLRWGPWRLPRRALLDADLPAAAQSGDRDAVTRLLALGLAVDARDAQGCSALLRAAGGGQEGIVEDLLAAGADASLAARTGATPLSAAVSMGHDRIVARLAAAGIDLDQPLPGGVTALMVAAALGNDQLVQALLVRGASALAQDQIGNTALHAAAQYAYAAEAAQPAARVIERLLDAGAPIDAGNREGQTPLLLLLGAHAEAGTRSPNRELAELISRLLHRGADLDAQDRRGISVLHAAAMHGMRDIAERLLQAGADPRRRDALARSAHEVAVLLGYVDLAALLKRD